MAGLDDLETTPFLEPAKPSDPSVAYDEFTLIGSVNVEDESPLVPVPSEWQGKTWSFTVAFAFGINYIMGIGVLSTPYAFEQAGLVLAISCMLFATLLSWQTAVWVLEAMARAETLVQHGFGGVDTSIMPPPDDLHPQHRISFRKFEVNELIKLYFGVKWDNTYTIFCIIYLWGALWAYAAIFANTLTSLVPMVHITTNPKVECDPTLDTFDSPCAEAYQLYVLVFACIVVSLCCMDLTGQKILQVALCAGNFFCMAAMLVSVCTAYFTMPLEPVASKPYVQKPALTNFGQFELIFSNCIFSQIIHHSIPGISQPVLKKEKLSQILAAIMATTFTIYCSLSILCSLYFGTKLNKILTLEWLSFPFNNTGTMPWWGDLISVLVVFLPVCQVTSCYPLNAITAGNNLFFTLPPRIRNIAPLRVKIMCRLTTCLPPIVGAVFLRDLSQIVTYTGLLGFLISLTIPALLNLQSLELCEQTWGVGSGKTMYATFFSNRTCTRIVIGFSLVCIVVLLANTFLHFL